MKRSLSSSSKRSSPSSTYTTTEDVEVVEVDQHYELVVPDRASSWVWKHFRAYDPKHLDKKGMIRCILCGPKVVDLIYGVSFKSTSKLTQHLASKHRDIYEAHFAEEARVQNIVEGPMKKFVSYGGDFMKMYCRWVVRTYQAIDTCNNPEFRDMCAALNPKASVIDRKSALDEIIKTKIVVKEELKSILKGEYHAVTFDHWTSVAGHAYTAATVHFIDDMWELHTATLCCEYHTNESTAPEIRREIHAVRTDYGLDLDKLVSITTDTASNMNSAGMLFEEHDQVPHHYCFAHVFELTAKKAFSDKYLPGADGVMHAARKLVGHFASSVQATTILLNLQPPETKDHHKVRVVQDVATRWWSTYSMCERLLRLQPFLAIMENRGELKCNLTCEQWINLGKIEKLLLPFMFAQKWMEGEAYVTISLVPYVISTVRSKLETFVRDHSQTPLEFLGQELLRDFNNRWGKGTSGKVFTENNIRGSRNRQKGIPQKIFIAAALDPRTKSLKGIPQADKDLIWGVVKDKLLQIMREEQNNNNENVAGMPVVAENIIENDNDFLFNEVEEPAIVQGADNENQLEHDNLGPNLEAQIEVEFARYKLEVPLPMRVPKGPNDNKLVFSNPLDWWKTKFGTYPIISKLARRVLCIPATSAPSERVFSNAGLTIANDRARLRVDNAAACIFLHDSLPVVEYFRERRRRLA